MNGMSRISIGILIFLGSIHETIAAKAPVQDTLPPPRLALCASGGEKADGMVALMEVELSRRDDVVLLDREHIRKVLAEHKLALEGLLSAGEALKVGQLLGCDVLAELHCEEATTDHAEVTSLVAFDALTGARFYDGALPPGEEPDRRAAAAAVAMAVGLGKWQGGPAVPDCRTLSFVSVRQLDLPETLKHAPKMLAILIKRRLVASAEVALLERRRLDLILKESRLSAVRRNALLESSVSVDLDLISGRENGDLELRAVLTDGAKRELGTVGVSGMSTDLDALATQLSRRIIAKLKLAQPGETDFAAGVEADRFLAEALRLEVRGRHDEAKVAELAATMLAEAALARTPWDVHVQKVACRLLRRQVSRAQSPSKAVEYLQRHVGYSEKWKYADDVSWFTTGLAEQLHFTLRRLGPARERDQVKTLRHRFGKWCKTMAERDPRCVGDLRWVEAWSTNPGELLRDCRQYFDSLPDGLGVARYAGAPEYIPAGLGGALYRIADFSPAERRTLLDLYDRWGTGGRVDRPPHSSIRSKGDTETSLDRRLDLFRKMQSHVCAAMLVNRFPGDFPDPAALVEARLRQAAAVVLEDPTLSGRFLHLCQSRGHKPPSIYQPLPRREITQQVLRLAEALDRNQVACPLLLEYLDEHDADRADHPGAHLERAWAQLDSPDYTPPVGDVLHPLFSEVFVERLRKTYRARYGRDVTATEASPIAEAELESIARVFEFDSVPGVSSIESSQLAGDWVYLLCLHTDPRSYELRRVNLHSHQREVLGEIITGRQYRARTGNEMHVGEETVYVPTSDGLICFARHEKKTWTITQEDGLPAARVTACLEAGGKLYLGLRGRQEGYLVVCDLESREVNVLACSGRKEKRSELDDCPPSTIDSLVYDEPRGRIFFTAMFLEPEAADRPWLWVYELQSGEIHAVHRRPYHPLQLRMLGDGRCVLHLADMHGYRDVTETLVDGRQVRVRVRAPSLAGARGYAVWDPATYAAQPLEDLLEQLVPVIGNLAPERLRIRYEVPTFCGNGHLLPGSTSSLALLGETYLVSSAVRRTPLALDPPHERYMINAQAGYGKRWQLIPRDDTGGTAEDLPLLDDEVPFMVREHDGQIVACTQGGVWLIRPALKHGEAQLVDGESRLEEESSRGKSAASAGTLVVKSPLGSLVRIDKDQGYRTWKDGRLTWNDLPAATYTVNVDYHGRGVSRRVDVRSNEVATVEASFGEEDVKTRWLDLGGGCRLKLVWVPPDRSEEAAKINLSYGDGFWMGQYEVTQQQYQAVMGTNPSSYRDPAHPVQRVGRHEAQQFCRRVTGKCAGQLDGLVARLPSASEWTHAWRGDATGKYNTGDSEDDLLRAGWMPENGSGRPHPVGLKMCNRFWLHDMHGNVAEWCERGGNRGGSWRSGGESPADATGFRILVTQPDSVLGRDGQGWTHLTHIDPIHAQVGWGTFIRYRNRDTKPGIGGTTFHTVMNVHANSSIKYKLDGKYTQFTANYGLWTGAHGVCRFVVLTDGEERFRSGHIYGLGGTSTIGVKNPVTLDVSGVDVLELRSVQADEKPLANACGLWGDAKIR